MLMEITIDNLNPNKPTGHYSIPIIHIILVLLQKPLIVFQKFEQIISKFNVNNLGPKL